MALTALAPTQVVPAGVVDPTPAATDASNHNSFLNDGNTWLHVTNTDAATQTLVVTSQYAGDSVFVRATTTYSLAAAASKVFGPFPVAYWGRVVQLTGSTATMHVAVLKF